MLKRINLNHKSGEYIVTNLKTQKVIKPLHNTPGGMKLKKTSNLHKVL